MKKVFLGFAALALLVSISSCRETTGDKAEEAVEAAAEDTENNLERAGDAIEEAAEDTGNALQEAGDAVEDAVDDMDDNN